MRVGHLLRKPWILFRYEARGICYQQPLPRGGEFRQGDATASSSDRMGRLRISNEFHEIPLDRPGGE